MSQKREVYYLRRSKVSFERTKNLPAGGIGGMRSRIIDQPSSKELDQSELSTNEISRSMSCLAKSTSDDLERPMTIKSEDSVSDISGESVQIESIQNWKKPKPVLSFSLCDVTDLHKNSLSVFSPEVKTESMSRPRNSSLWNAFDFWRSSTLAINTKNLSACSFTGEVLSSIKLDSFIIFGFICGVGYEGRLSISKWYVILETIHCCPTGIVIAAFADSVFIISNMKLYNIFTIGLVLIFYVSPLFFVVMFANVLYSYLMNCVMISMFVLIVYACCSKGFYVRARYLLFYVVSYSLLSFATIIMLHFKFWTALLLVFTPADLMINWTVVEATKTCDRLLFLEVNAIIYCAVFENVRYLSLLGIIDEEMDYTLELATFAAVDVLCIFISKSEILTYINFHTHWLGKDSKTWLLASRTTRACMTVTTLSWPIWNIGFDLGRLLMKPNRNGAEFAKKIELLLVMNYIPELLSEIALYIYLKCIPSGKYAHGRLSYMSSLRPSLHLAAFCSIPGILLGLRILID